METAVGGWPTITVALMLIFLVFNYYQLVS
jgi:hypothetical protein